MADEASSIPDSIPDAVPTKGPNSRGGRGGKSNNKRGGGRGGGQPREMQISRALSRLLRHQASAAGIKLDGEGFARLDAVLAWGPLRSLGVTMREVRDVVNDNDKQRFALKAVPGTTTAADLLTPVGTPLPSAQFDNDDPANYLIRANQGHSIKLESSALLQELSSQDDVPPRVLHGTYYAFWPAIVASGGLRRMGRTHVHCSTGTPEDNGTTVVSGMRRDAELLVEVDVVKSIQEGGLRWWRSDNGVILTEGNDEGLVPARFFKRVSGRNTSVGTLWENGAWVSDLPADLKIRVPHGKGPREQKGQKGPKGDQKKTEQDKS